VKRREGGLDRNGEEKWTNLLRRLVEHLRLSAESVGPFDEVVELLSSLEDGFDGFVLRREERRR